MEIYKTVRNEAKAEQTIEKSRFTAHVKPVESREEAEEFIDGIRREYKDATHNVPAIVIGDKMQIQWGSDDGEPQGTSGAPIVQMLVKEGITNVAVVVTRYFGGIKLGTGGLVRAYTSSARLGIEAAGVCGVCEVCVLETRVDYTYFSAFQHMASESLDERGKGPVFVLRDIRYSDKVTMDILTDPEKKQDILGYISNTTAGSAEILGEKIILEKM